MNFQKIAILTLCFSLVIFVSCKPPQAPVSSHQPSAEHKEESSPDLSATPQTKETEIPEISLEDTIATYEFNGKTEAIQVADVVKDIQGAQGIGSTNEEEREEAVRAGIRSGFARIVFYKEAEKQSPQDYPGIEQAIKTNKMIQNMLIGKFRNHIARQVADPTDEEIAKFYAENQSEFWQKEKYLIKYMTFTAVNPEQPEAMAAAKTRAQEALDKVKSGADFTETAVALSDSPKDPSEKGKAVPIAINEVFPSISETVKKLQPGQISDLIPIRSGYMVAQLIEHTPEGASPLEEVKGRIVSTLQRQKMDNHWNEYWNAYLAKIPTRKNLEILDQEEIEDSAVLMEAGDIRFTYADLKIAAGKSRDNKELLKEICGMIFESLPLVYAAEQEGWTKDPEFIKSVIDYRMFEVFASKVEELIPMDTVEVSEEELKDYFENNRDRYQTPAETEIKVIRIQADLPQDATSGTIVSPKAKALAYQAASQAYARIQKGEDFEVLMNEYNRDWNGHYPSQPAGARGYILDNACRNMQIGEVSQPVEYSHGFYIIKMVNRKESRPKSFEEARENLLPTVRFLKTREKQDELFQNMGQNYNLIMDDDLVRAISARFAPRQS